MNSVRQSPIAGTWYPGTAAALTAAVDAHLARAAASHLAERGDSSGELVALIAPHAGLMYSGPVAAYAYQLLRGRSFDVIVLVGPSHFVPFEGVAVYPSGGFQTPLGVVSIDERLAADLVRTSGVVRAQTGPHGREHSLEMQLPFVQRLSPDARIVPLLIGHQTAATARELGDALGRVLPGRKALIVASTDLSHYHDATTAARLDATVIDCVTRFDADALQRALDRQPEHACGGGPTVAVMRAALALGATDSVVLRYADSGDVSGDKSSVVGYMAAALGRFGGRPS